MNDSEGAALLAAINENPADLAPRLIYSDWLEENGRLNEALAWRGHVAKNQPIFEEFEAGGEDWYGLGDGARDGNAGHEGYGSGHGYGHGYRYGEGDGLEYRYIGGQGYENWRQANGDGGEQRDLLKKQNAWILSHKEILKGKPVIGKQMLIWCGRGFVWIGLVEEMYAPGCYKLSNAGMLCRTGPDSWMAVASGAPPGITTSTGTPRTASSIPGRNCMGRLSGRGNFPVRT